MKLGRVTKLYKRNTTTVAKFDNDVVSLNFDVIVSIPIYGWFGAIGKSNSGCMVYNS